MTATPRPRTAVALGRVIDETRSLFPRLRHVAEVIHAPEKLNAGARGVLVELADHGPRTVPDMARARPVSRQHIQTLVNDLLARSLVEQVPNPRHRRSSLVQLTRAGSRLVERVKAREARVLATLGNSLRPAIDAGALERTADTMRVIRLVLAEKDLERIGHTEIRQRGTRQGSGMTRATKRTKRHHAE